MLKVMLVVMITSTSIIETVYEEDEEGEEDLSAIHYTSIFAFSTVWIF